MGLDWQQELFDLMSNEMIRLTVTGDCIAVDATLELYQGVAGWNEVAQVSEESSLDDALTSLLTRFRLSVNRHA